MNLDACHQPQDCIAVLQQAFPDDMKEASLYSGNRFQKRLCAGIGFLSLNENGLNK
jgi:hypothetical protein